MMSTKALTVGISLLFPQVLSASDDGGRSPLTSLRGGAQSMNDVVFMSTNNIDNDTVMSLRSEQPNRLLSADEDAVILLLPLSFQIAMSIVLGIIAMSQIALLGSFIYHRSKRVLEFAQPLVICFMICCGLITTCACYLFLYASNVGCVVREPIIFISLTAMGASIAGRGWRISTLLNNPLISAGRGTIDTSLVERARQFVLQFITVFSGCNLTAMGLMCSYRGRRPIRVQISTLQMVRAVSVLILPQLLLQIAIMAAPTLRAVNQVSYSSKYGVTIGRYECKSAAVYSWQIYVSALLGLLPYCCAYLLNLRSKSELEQLPGIIDERDRLQIAVAIFVLIASVAGPVGGMANDPRVRAYSIIALVISLPLSMCYNIAFTKLSTLSSNTTKQRRNSQSSSLSGLDGGGESSVAFAVKMAQMYQTIGRFDETIQLVDETLGVWRKSSNNAMSNLGQYKEGREEIGSGLTRNDLISITPNELELIVQLLQIKGRSLMAIHGQAGMPMSAKLNVDALKIFENCPAATKLKDTSIIFPVYSLVANQIKLGVIEIDQADDDEFALEMELAQRYNDEAQVQAHHYARSLINLAELHGRKGNYKQAQKYFNVMKSVYMQKEHPKLLRATYSVDHCAVGYATSALWLLQQDKVDKAIERCEYVIKHILPNYDDKDIVGLFAILLPIVRVLKWNGHVGRAYEVYDKYTPDGMENHFAVGDLHKPLLLLLKICSSNDVSSDQCNRNEDWSNNIELALSFNTSDMADHIYTSYCWSMKSLCAELCLRLASRLKPGDATRERLVDRGIQMSTACKNLSTASNGMIKHILAYTSNSEVHKELLELAKENDASCRSVIHDNQSLQGRNISDDSTTTTPTEFSHKLMVRECPSNGSESKATTSAPPKSTAITCKPSNIRFESKKKVSFSQTSSLESCGLAESRNSQDSAISAETNHNQSDDASDLDKHDSDPQSNVGLIPE